MNFCGEILLHIDLVPEIVVCKDLWRNFIIIR